MTSIVFLILWRSFYNNHFYSLFIIRNLHHFHPTFCILCLKRQILSIIEDKIHKKTNFIHYKR